MGTGGRGRRSREFRAGGKCHPASPGASRLGRMGGVVRAGEGLAGRAVRGSAGRPGAPAPPCPGQPQSPRAPKPVGFDGAGLEGPLAPKGSLGRRKGTGWGSPPRHLPPGVPRCSRERRLPADGEGGPGERRGPARGCAGQPRHLPRGFGPRTLSQAGVEQPPDLLGEAGPGGRGGEGAACPLPGGRSGPRPGGALDSSSPGRHLARFILSRLLWNFIFAALPPLGRLGGGAGGP